MKKQEEFKISSETDLEREFDSISSQLTDTSKLYSEIDWNLRIKALKRMQALISSDYIAFENFPALFLKFTAPLSVQLQDLRSAVVKEACSTIVLAASVLGDSFELSAERLSDVLYRLINSGNKILAESGSDCYIEIIKSIVTWRLIPKTLEQFSCKNANIRMKACTFLQTMLELYPIEVFEYAANNKTGFLDKLEQGLKIVVHDASSETRAIARKAFLGYRNFFPARANKLFSSFDSSIQRAFGELTETKSQNFATTPARSTSASSNRMATSAGKYDPRSVEKLEKSEKVEKKPRNSLNEVRDLGSTGGTTPEIKHVKEVRDVREVREVRDAREVREVRDNRDVREAKTIEKKEAPGLDVWIHITNDANWEARVMAFENIRKIVVEEQAMRQLNSSKGLWDLLVNAHLEQLAFSNFRVVAGCITSLIVVTETFPEKISLALERILPRLLVCLSSNKEPVVSAAGQLLELIIDVYIPEDLLALLLKYSANDVKANAYVKFAEVVFKLAETSTEFFDLTANVRLYIHKLLVVAKEVNKVQARNLVPAFELALERNRKDTAVVVLDLSPQDSGFLRNLVQEARSGFESIFRESQVKDTQRPVPQLQELRKPEKPSIESRSSLTQEPKPQVVEKPSSSQSTKPLSEGKSSHSLQTYHTTQPQFSPQPVQVPQSAPQQAFMPMQAPSQSKPVQSLPQAQSSKPESKFSKEPKAEGKIVVLHTEFKQVEFKKPEPVKQPAEVCKKPVVQTDLKKQFKEESKSFSPGSRQENLKKVKSLNDELDNLDFDRCFRDVLNILELCIEDGALVEASILTFQGIMQKRKAICLNWVAECLAIMSKGFYLESRHLLQLTEETIEELVVDQPCGVIVPVIIQSIKLNEVPAVQAFIRILTKVVTAAKPPQLAPLLRVIMNQMKESLNHSNADVRKSVVFCLVEVQGIIGSEFAAYLDELTPSQQKLVTIYIQRRITS